MEESLAYLPTSDMHPDVGAIIGISLAGCVLLVGLVFLCVMQLSCCKNGITTRRGGNGNRRINRSSASSQSAFANCGASRTSSVEQLSAMDLRNQSQNRAFHSVNGLVNPLWQFPCACQSARMISASQQSLNYVHCHPVHPCQHIYAQQLPAFNNGDNNNPHVTSDPVSFQYSTPQLVSPPDSPPPYPGLNAETTSPQYQNPEATRDDVNRPPPYVPKEIAAI